MKYTSILLSIFSIFVHSTQLFHKFTVEDSVHRRSLCNDGSPSIFYLFQSTSANRNKKWIIHFDGGGGCSTIETCEYRFKHDHELMTSDGFPENGTRDHGIFSADCEKNPAVCDFGNKVYVHYCSSDRWSGDNDKSQTTGYYYFHGKNIVMSVIEDLYKYHGLDHAEVVITSGDSAGGEGIWNRGDQIGDFLESNVKTLRDYRILSGCGWFVNGTGYSQKTVTFEETVRLGASPDFWNFIPQKECGQYFGDKSYLCLVGYLVYPHVRHEKMGIFLEYDLVQSGYDGIGKSKIEDLTKEERKWINYRGDFVQSVVQNVKNVWTAGCWRHDILPGSRFTDWKTLDGTSPAYAVKEWIDNGVSKHIDKCSDLACNPYCT